MLTIFLANDLSFSVFQETQFAQVLHLTCHSRKVAQIMERLVMGGIKNGPEK